MVCLIYITAETPFAGKREVMMGLNLKSTKVYTSELTELNLSLSHCSIISNILLLKWAVRKKAI